MRNSRLRAQNLLGAGVILGTLAACGTPAPVAEMSAAQTAVTGAEERAMQAKMAERS